MRSFSVISGENALAQQFTNLRHDAKGGGFLLAHQTLGSFALGTNPADGKTLTLTINGTAVVFTFKSSLGASAGNVLIGGTAAATAANLLALLNQPQTTTSTGVALSAANQTLLSYLSYLLNSTTLIVSSNNTSLYAPLTSYSASTNATSDSWTGNTMALAVEPGVVYVNGTRVIYSGGLTPTVSAPGANPRIDVLTIDSSGTLAWTTGSENASPTAPTYPANKVAICELYNVVSETVLYDNSNQTAGQGYVYNDVRPTLTIPLNLLAVPSNILPDGDGTRNLGSASFRWNEGRFVTLYGNASNLTSIPSPNIASGTISDNTNVAISGGAGTNTDTVVTYGLGRTPNTVTITCFIQARGDGNNDNAWGQAIYGASGVMLTSLTHLIGSTVSGTTGAVDMIATGVYSSNYNARITVKVVSIGSTSFTFRIIGVTLNGSPPSSEVIGIAWVAQ